MIARLDNGNLIPCPIQAPDGSGRWHTNMPRYYEQHPDMAAEDGYYPVQRTDKPADGDYLPSWTLQEVEGVMMIVQVWTPYTPAPEPEDPVTARLDMIEECLLELSEVIYA